MWFLHGILLYRLHRSCWCKPLRGSIWRHSFLRCPPFCHSYRHCSRPRRNNCPVYSKPTKCSIGHRLMLAHRDFGELWSRRQSWMQHSLYHMLEFICFLILIPLYLANIKEEIPKKASKRQRFYLIWIFAFFLFPKMNMRQW